MGYKFELGDPVKTALFGANSRDVVFKIIDRKTGNSSTGRMYRVNHNARFYSWIDEGWFETPGTTA